ncbi:MAG: hypothetical protein NTX72_04460 [Candidatus Uhrbacteria bacterium]|nr:hypothetical protein [Candidatus Uhrbacteria bacterium]
MNYKHSVLISVLVVCCVGLIGLLVYRVNLSRTVQTLRPATEETSKPEALQHPFHNPRSRLNHQEPMSLLDLPSRLSAKRVALGFLKDRFPSSF